MPAAHLHRVVSYSRADVDGKKIHVYALHDPSDNYGPVYIGQTVNPRHRMAGHLSAARRKAGKWQAPIWIRSMLDDGRKPHLMVLEVCPDRSTAHGAEQDHIAYYRSIGMVIINECAGGAGNPGWSPPTGWVNHVGPDTAEMKASPEYRAMMSAKYKGKPQPDWVVRARMDRLRGARLIATNKTGFRGVCSVHGKYRAYITKEGPGARGMKPLGTYPTVEDAARAYDAEARKRWGKEAALNFPEPGERSARRAA